MDLDHLVVQRRKEIDKKKTKQKQKQINEYISKGNWTQQWKATNNQNWQMEEKRQISQRPNNVCKYSALKNVVHSSLLLMCSLCIVTFFQRGE